MTRLFDPFEDPRWEDEDEEEDFEEPSEPDQQELDRLANEAGNRWEAERDGRW